MKKSLLSLMLALVLALGCLSGFTASAEELEQVTLKVWLGGPGTQKDSEAVFAKFNEQLPNYLPNTKVEFLAVTADEYSEKWSKAMAAQEQIDVAWFGWVLNLNDEIAMGSLTPLNELVAQYGQDMAAILGEAALEAHRFDGELYAIPCWQAVSALGVGGIYLRQDILDALPNQNYFDEFSKVQREAAALGYNPEGIKLFYSKLDEYMAGAKEAGIESAGYYDVAAGAFGPRGFGDYTALEGYILWGDDTFTLQVPYFADTAAAEAEMARLDCLRDFWEKGYFRSDLLSAEKTGFGQSQGKTDAESAAIYTHNAQGFLKGSYTDEEIHAGMSERYGIDMKMVQLYDNTVATKGFDTATCIPYTSKNPERAMMYMNLINSPKGAELYQTLVYGIEGQHWTRTDDTYIEVAGGTTQATSDWAYGQWKWAIGNCVNTLPMVGEDPEYWQKLAVIEQKAVVRPTLNFNIDYSNVDVERMNCNAIKDEYDLSTLFVYDDYAERIQERNDKLMAAGYEELNAEIQKQLTAYLETVEDKTWPTLFN